MAKPRRVALTISENKILTLSFKHKDSDKNAKNEEIFMLSIVDCEVLEDAVEVVENFNFKNFPNIFIISVDVKNYNHESAPKLGAAICEPTSQAIPILLEINYGTKVEFYYKNYQEQFKIALPDKTDLFAEKSFTVDLNIEHLIEILRSINCLICFADLFRILLSFPKSETKRLNFEQCDEFCVRFFNLFDYEGIKAELLTKTLASKSLRPFLAFMNVQSASQIDEKAIDEVLKINPRALQDALWHGNYEVVEIFFKLKEKVDFLNDEWKVFMNRVRDNERFDVMNYLKNSLLLTSTYDDFDKTFQDVNELHDYIKIGNLKKVKEFTENYPNFKICCNFEGISALDRSLDFKKFAIFTFLQSKNFEHNSKTFDKKCEFLNSSEKREIRLRTCMFKSFTHPEAKPRSLLYRCKFSNTSNSEANFAMVKTMIDDLSKLPDIEAISSFALKSSLRIFFDFSRSINNNMSVVAYFRENLIYFGSYESERHLYGEFAQQLMRFVLNLIYGHNGLPYFAVDDAKTSEFNEVFEKTREKFEQNHDDEVLKHVFSINNNLIAQKIELATCIAYLVAFHYDNPAKIDEIRQNHPELYQFYFDLINFDFKIPNIYEMSKINHHFDVLKMMANTESLGEVDQSMVLENNKSLLLGSNIPNFTIKNIFYALKIHEKSVARILAQTLFINTKLMDRRINKKLSKKNLHEQCKRIVVYVDQDYLYPDCMDFLKAVLNEFKSFVVILDGELNMHQFFKRNFSFGFSLKCYSWNDLKKEEKAKLLNKNLKFQGNFFKVGDLISNPEAISSEILADLLSKDEICVNSRILTSNSLRVFKENSREREVSAFALKDMKDKKFVLISSRTKLEGTSMLKSVHDILTTNNPSRWVSYINLKAHSFDFCREIEDNFPEFICRILKLSNFEAMIFAQKYTAGDVVILLDGYEHLLQSYRKNLLKFLRLFNVEIKNLKFPRTRPKLHSLPMSRPTQLSIQEDVQLESGDPVLNNQLWITTNTDLECELETELNVSANTPKAMSEIKILFTHWSKKNPDKNHKLILKCAVELSERINEKHFNLNLLSVSSIAPILACAFENAINDNFSVSIENLCITEVFERFIKVKFNKFHFNIKNDKDTLSSLLEAHQFVAVSSLFGGMLTNGLDLHFDAEKWSPEKITQAGFLSLDDKTLKFENREMLDFFAASFIFKIVKSVKYFNKNHLTMIFRVLEDKEFSLIQMFLNDMLKRVDDSSSLYIFNYCEAFCDYGTRRLLKILNICSDEGFADILSLILELIKSHDVKLLTSLIEDRAFSNGKTIWMKILPKVRRKNLFEKYLSLIVDFYADDIEDEFLLAADNNENTIFHHLTLNLEYFPLFFNKFAENQEFFFLENRQKQTFLHLALENSSNGLEEISAVVELIRKFLDVDGQKELVNLKDARGFNALFMAVKREMFDVVSQLDESARVFYPSTTSLEVFKEHWSKVEDKKGFLMAKDRFGCNMLHFLTMNKVDSPFLWNFFMENWLDDFKNLILDKNSDNDNFVTLTVKFGSIKSVHIMLINLLKPKLDSVLRERGKNHENLLQMVAGSEIKLLNFMWHIFEQTFSKQILMEILHEGDDSKNVLMHTIASKASSKEAFDFIFSRIRQMFEDRENLKNYLMTKNASGKNPLMVSVESKLFLHILEVYKEHLSTHEILQANDKDGNNLLILIARHCSIDYVEASFEQFRDEISTVDMENYFKGAEVLIAAENYNTEQVYDFICHSFFIQPANCASFVEKVTFKAELNALKWFSSDDESLMSSTSLNNQKLNPLTVTKILSKCRMSSSNTRDELKNLIERTCSSVELILMAETVASYEKLIFDFNCSLEASEYRAELRKHGEDLLYVPIVYANLEEKVKKFTFELTRCAMKILYENRFLPYFEHQKSKEAQLKRIIGEVLGYEDKETYSSDSDDEFESTDRKLFKILPDYFSQRILADETFAQHKTNKEIASFFKILVQPDLEICGGNEIRELNRKFCLLKRLRKPDLKLSEKFKKIQLKNLNQNIFIKSNVPRLVLERVFTQAKPFGCVDAENLFVNLNLIDFEDIRDAYEKIASSESVRRIFVDATDDVSQKNVQILTEGTTAPLIIVGGDESLFADFKVKVFNFTWENLCENSKKFLLNKRIKFQNMQVKFGEIFPSNLENLPPDFIKILCSNSQQVVINSETFSNEAECLSRRFQIKRKASDDIFFMRDQPADFFYTENVSHKALFKHVESSRIVLLADKPKSGKTIALKQIWDKLTKAGKYVKYLALEGRKVALEGQNGTHEEDFLSFASKLLPKVEERVTFEAFLNRGEAICIIDGISDEFDVKKLIKILKSFKNMNNNQLWLGASGKIGDEIEAKLNPVRIKLAFITDEEEKRFLSESNGHSLTKVCENFVNDELKNSPRSTFHFYALKAFLNCNDTEIFGLSHDFVEFPMRNSKIIKFDSAGRFSLFTSPCFIPYFIADFIKISLENFQHDKHNFFDMFLHILTCECENVRKMLNDMEITPSIDCGNALKASILKANDPKFTFSEENLAICVINILKQADREESFQLADLIAKILMNLIPNFPQMHNFVVAKILQAAFGVSTADFEKILKFKVESRRIFELIAENSSDERLIEFIVGKIDVDFDEFINNVEDDFCIFKVAIKKENFSLLAFLLRNVSFAKWKKVLKAAFDSENIQIFDVVKGKLWPKEEDEVILILNEYEQIFSEISLFHRSVKEENMENMENFINKYPKLKSCRGRELHPAIQVACISQKFKSFEFLHSKGFTSSNLTDLCVETYQRKLLNENLAKCTKSEAHYKGLLLAKCLKSPNSSSLPFKDIETMIDDLFSLEDVKEILETIATTEVEVIFILEYPHTGNFDAERDEFTDGLFYVSKNQILVSQCTDERTRYGVFAHEATHSAMLSLYRNNCKPYSKSDKESEEKWLKIIENLKEKFSKNQIDEKIIENVFLAYEKALYNAELAVRIPQILAFYRGIGAQSGHHEDDEVTHLEIKHHDFFGYFRDKTLKDLKIVDGKPLRSLNEKFMLWGKVEEISINFNVHKELKEVLFAKNHLIFTTKSPLLLMKSLFDVLTNFYDNLQDFSGFLHAKSANLFVDATTLDEHSLKDLVSLSTSRTVQRIIFNCDKLDGEDLREKLEVLENSSKQLIFINPGKNFELIKSPPIGVQILWSENCDENTKNVLKISLNQKSRDTLMNKNIKFQTKASVKFSKIVSLNESLPEKIINFMTFERRVEVNRIFKKSAFLYPRKFLNVKKSTSTPHSLSELIQLVKNNKFILISDVAGSGKSRALEIIFDEVVDRNSQNEFWVSHISLEDHEDLLLNDTSSEALIHKMLKISSELEAFAFERFSNNSKVILFIDGIDRIRSDAARKAISLVKGGNFSQIFLTSRIYMESLIRSELTACKVFALEPLDRDEKINFVNLLQSNKKISHVAFKSLEAIDPHEFFPFPHFIGMLIEIHGVDFSALNFSEIKLLDFCELSYLKHYEKHAKGFDQRSMNFEQIHTYFALVEHFERDEDIFGHDYDEDEWSADDLNRCGLLDNLKFANLIIPQFLKAKFISKHLFKAKERFDHKKFMKFFCKILTSQMQKDARDLLDGMMKHEEFHSVNEYFSEILRVLLSEDEQTSKLLVKSFAEGHFNICHHLIKIIKNHRQKVNHNEFFNYLWVDFEDCFTLASAKVNAHNDGKFNKIKNEINYPTTSTHEKNTFMLN